MAFSPTRTLANIFRRYVTDGVPASGPKQVDKDEVRTWGNEIEGFATDLDVRLTAAEGDLAPMVYDPTFNAGPPTTAMTGFNTDTYIPKSKLIIIEDDTIQEGTRMKWRLHVSKTAAGTAAPVIRIRIETAGNISDSQRCTLTFDNQTAATDEGIIDIFASFLSSGTGAQFIAVGMLNHQNTTTGLANKSVSIVSATSTSFNTSLPNLKVGLSLDAGGSANWTLDYVEAILENLA